MAKKMQIKEWAMGFVIQRGPGDESEFFCGQIDSFTTVWSKNSSRLHYFGERNDAEEMRDYLRRFIPKQVAEDSTHGR